MNSTSIPKFQFPSPRIDPVFKKKKINKEELVIKNNSDSESSKIIEKQSERMDDIICPKCTVKLNPFFLEDHFAECKYKVCRFCREYYPEEILRNHRR